MTVRASLLVGVVLAMVCLCLAFGGGFVLARLSASHEWAEPTPPPVTATITPISRTHETTVTIPTPSPRLPLSASGLACTTAVVATVIDGDTVVLDNGETVRYIGIDTPESDECFGQEATEMNRQLVGGKTVTLIGDVEDRGQYGRLLFYVIADGRFVNAELVRLGYARAESYGDNVMFQQVLTVFERYAYENGAGLWSACAQ